MACCLWHVDPTRYHHSIPISGGMHLRIVLTRDLPVRFSFIHKTVEGMRRKFTISSLAFENLEVGYDLGKSWTRYSYKNRNVQYLATKVELGNERVQWCDFAKRTTTTLFDNT